MLCGGKGRMKNSQLQSLLWCMLFFSGVTVLAFSGKFEKHKKPFLSSWPISRAFLAQVALDEDRMFLVGGLSGKSVENLKDSWIYSASENKFKQLADLPINSSGITQHSIVKYNDDLYVYGGTWTEAYLGGRNELWKYSITSNMWSLVDKAGQNRTGHLAWVYKDKIYLHGSDSDNIYSDTLGCFDFESEGWSNIHLRNAPKLRVYNHNGHMVNSTHMMIFGGEFPFSTNNGSAALINMETMVWSDIPLQYPAPTGRYNYAMVNIEKCSKLVIYGGESDFSGLNDMWTFDYSGGSNQWENIPRDVIWPDNLAGTAYAYVDSLVLFAGCDLVGFCNYPDDMWQFKVDEC